MGCAPRRSQGGEGGWGCWTLDIEPIIYNRYVDDIVYNNLDQRMARVLLEHNGVTSVS